MSLNFEAKRTDMATIGGTSDGKIMADVTIEEIRTWWKVPAVAHFCSLFRGTFGLPDFEIEELEEALFMDAQEGESPFIIELLVRLLRGCYQRKDIEHHNYLEFLRDTMKHRWETEEKRVNPLSNEDTTFTSLSTLMKVEIMNSLCDYRLDAPDVSALKDFYGEHLRIEPLGKDGSGALYWYFYGTRLYKEEQEPTKEEQEAKRKKRLKEKKKKLQELQAARRKLNQKEKVKKEKTKKEKDSKQKKQKKERVQSESDEDEEPKSSRGGKKGKNSKQPKAKEESNDEVDEVKTKAKKHGKKGKSSEDNEEVNEDQSSKKYNRKRKKDTEDSEDKTATSQKRGRQPKKAEDEDEDVNPRKKGKTSKKRSNEDDSEGENERTKKKGSTQKKGSKGSNSNSPKPGKIGKKSQKEVQTTISGANDNFDEKNAFSSADEESDNQPLIKLKKLPHGTKLDEGNDKTSDSNEVTVPNKRGRANKVKTEEDPQPKKRGRTTKKVKGEEEEKTPTKRSRSKNAKQEDSDHEEDTPKKGQVAIKQEAKYIRTLRGKKIKEEDETNESGSESEGAPTVQQGQKTKLIKEEVSEADTTNTDDTSTVHSTATSIPVSSEESSDDDLEEAPRWHLVCHTEDDWIQLTEKLKKSRLKCERELHKVLLNDFLPEIKALLAEKERDLRKRLFDMAPRRVSDRIVTLRIKQDEEERLQSLQQKLKVEADARRKAFGKAFNEQARSLQVQQDEEQQERDLKRRKEARAKRARLREQRLEYIRDGKEIPEELQKALHSSSAQRWKSSVDDDDEETHLGLTKVLEAVRTHPESWPFLEAVSESYAPGYYNIVKYPMDLTTMERKLNDKLYSDKDEFVNDMHQIFQNCVDYNGPGSEYTLMAETVEVSFDKYMDVHFPDAGDSETDDDDFTTVDYFREKRGIRREPLRHTTRNTSASRAKMEMSVHTMMQSSSAESSPHSSEYEFRANDKDSAENGERNENTVVATERTDNEKEDKPSILQGDSAVGTNQNTSIFKQETKNFQQGFEQYVSMRSPNSVPKKTPEKTAPKKPRNNNIADDKKNTSKQITSKSDDAVKAVDIKSPAIPETNAVNVNTSATSEVIASSCIAKEDKDSNETVVPQIACPEETVPVGNIGGGNIAEGALLTTTETQIAAAGSTDNSKKPERKKRQYKKRAKKTDDAKAVAVVDAKNHTEKTNAVDDNNDAQGQNSTENSEGSKPKEKKKRERKKKEPKEGDKEKKPRKKRSKKVAKESEISTGKENETDVPTAGVNTDVGPSRSDGSIGTGQQKVVLHKVDCEPGKFSPSIDGHEAKIIRIPNPMHSANMNLSAGDEQCDDRNSLESRMQMDYQVSNRVSDQANDPAQEVRNDPAQEVRNDQSEQGISNQEIQMSNQKPEHSSVNQEWTNEPMKSGGSVLGQFLNTQEHNFLQGRNTRKENLSETQLRPLSGSSEQVDVPQRVPLSSHSNFVPMSPPYYPHQSDYSAPHSHDQPQPQPQPMMSNVTQDSVQQQQQQQQQHTMIDLNSRRPPHPFQAPPQRHELSQPGLPSAFQRLPFQSNRDSQDGYAHPSVITKVPPMFTNSSSDHSMPTNTQTVDSGNTSTSDSVFSSRSDQYHGQQFTSQGPNHSLGQSVPQYWERNMPSSYNLASTGNFDPPISSTAPSVEQEQSPERPAPERRSSEEAPMTKLWRPHSNGQQDSASSSSRPPSTVAPLQDLNSESNRTLSETEQGLSRNILGSLLHKSPQGVQQLVSSHPVSPALSSSSHSNRGDAASHSAFASPRPPSIGGSSQHPLAGAGSPLQPQTSPAVSQNSLPPQSPHLTDHRVPYSSPPHTLTSPRSIGDPTPSETPQHMPSSMQGLMREATPRASSINYMPPMLNSDPSLQMKDYLEAERMCRTPSAAQELQRYMEMNGSRFGMASMHSQSSNPYAQHPMQQMGQPPSVYGNQLPMPASQPLPASFSSYTAAASPHLRQLLHNRIPTAAGNQSSMMSHSAYATQSPLGMGLGGATSMYGGYDRQGPYSTPHGYSMHQAAELQQYYQQHSQALQKQAAGYYSQPGVASQYLDAQPSSVPPHAAYNPAAMMGGSRLPPGYE